MTKRSLCVMWVDHSLKCQTLTYSSVPYCNPGFSRDAIDRESTSQLTTATVVLKSEASVSAIS